MKLRRAASALLLLLAGALPGAAPLAAQQNPQKPIEQRDLAEIVKEQQLLAQQLERLRNTMEKLLERIEAEGRTRTAELLREGLTLLDQRADPKAGLPLTLEERMAAANEALTNGQLFQSLEAQRQLVSDLERLLSILLDRKDIEGLDQKIENLKALQEDARRLADLEAGLRDKTGELRQQAGGEEQKKLEQGLSALQAEQERLLAANEEQGRAAGTLEIEQLERELEKLLLAQRTDRDVLSAWDPHEGEGLTQASASLDEAQKSEARAARLTDDAQRLRTAAQELESGAKPAEDVAEALRTAAENARRHAKASNDAAASKSAEALERAAAQLQGEGGPTPTPAEAAKALRSAAEPLNAEAARQRAEAAAARQRADKELEASAGQRTPTGEAARDVREALARARQDESREGGARAATEEAAKALEKARSELQFLGQALSGSQDQQAQKTERLQRGLESMPQGKSAAGETARSALERAAEAMRQASQAARNREQDSATQSAEQGERALEEAKAALAETRAAAAQSGAQQGQELAGQQAQAAQTAQKLGQQASSAALSPQAEKDVQQALEEAREAMEQASQELQQGKSASAAGSQRKAAQALQRAGQSAQQGVRLGTEEQRQQAEELAAEQEKIRQQILDLARRIQERQNPRSRPDLAKAGENAQSAKESLQQGDPAQAEQEEQEVERELRQARTELQEEEQQYQRLRAEEQLFRIAEEAQTLLEQHREQMTALREVDAERAGAAEPGRAQKIRLRDIGRKEAALGTRATELSKAVELEGTKVAAGLLADVASDLDRIGRDVSTEGDFQTGERVQGLQRDVEQSLGWLLEALRAEQARRKDQQQQQQQPNPQQDQDQSKPPLVPDSTELKLLKRMELDLQESVDELRRLNPDLATRTDVDEGLLQDITRLAARHERLTQLFKDLRARVGIEAPGEAQD